MGVDVPKDINGRATIHIYDTYYKNTECRIIAIDNSEKIHIPKQTSILVPEKQYRSTNGIFPNLKLSQIKEFRFQTRVITNEQK
ncbi:MAG: hypothetical protein JW787_15130 [Sedimentisphaerales bacterium]|nr:hypothetical protein [Sedimentisphaerales bacterium]